MTLSSKSILFPIILVFYEISNYLSNDMYLPAVPQMMRDFALNTTQIQLTMTLWFTGLASMPLFVGMISDRFGRRPVLLAGGFIYVLSTLLCALTTNFNVLLAARFVEGSMVGCMMVAGYAAIHETYAPKEAVRILALMGSVTVLAPTLGPLIGGLILQFFSWRLIFWIITIWATVALLALIKWMPETLSIDQRKKIRLLEFLPQYKNVVCNQQYMILMLVLGFIFCGFIIWITAGPLLVIESFQQSSLVFGLIQAAVFTAYIFGSHVVNYLVKQAEVSQVIKQGLTISFVGGFLTFVISWLFSEALFAFLLPMMIYSFGSAFCFAPLNRAIIDSSQEPMGIRVALFTVFFTAFGALGSILASVFFNGELYSMALPLFICVLLSCVLRCYATQ